MTQIGKQLGPYTVEKVLDKRNHIYLVHGQAHTEQLMVRRLCRADEFNAQAFEDRMAQLATLTHPHILVAGQQAFEHQSDIYLRMPHISAVTLQAVLRKAPRRRLPLADALYILRAISDALTAAHGHHIVHRNLKPSNILLDRDAQVVITDFDIGGQVGATAYVSPEQAAGQPPSPLDDVYSLAVVTYEMLTGHVPYEPIAAARDVPTAHDKLTLPSEHEPAIPIRVEEVILQGFAKKPEQRFQSAVAFYEALASANGRSHQPEEAVLADLAASMVKQREAHTERQSPLAPSFGLVIGAVFALSTLAAFLLILLR